MRSDCPISCALELVGDHWTLLILRDLLFSNKRGFSELAQSEKIASNILANRLNRLEEEGLIERRSAPNDRRRRLIQPTEKAWALAPVLLELAIYGHNYCGGIDSSSLVSAARQDRESVLQNLRALAAEQQKE